MSDAELREQISRLEDTNRELLQTNSELKTQILCLEEKNKELTEYKGKTMHCVSKFLQFMKGVEFPIRLKIQTKEILTELLSQVFVGEDIKAWF